MHENIHSTIQIMRHKFQVKLVTYSGSVFLALAETASVAEATMLNVVFGGNSYADTGAAPDTGAYWNRVVGDWVSPVNATGLTYSDGTTPASGVTITSSASVGSYANGPGLTGSRIFNIFPSPYSGVTAPFDLTISGLNSSKSYDLYCYGSWPGYATEYSVGAKSDYALGDLSGPPYVHNDHYALLQGLKPVGGEITLHLDYYGNGTAPVIGALQLGQAAVPEPSTWLAGILTGLPMLGMSLRRIGK